MSAMLEGFGTPITFDPFLSLSDGRAAGAHLAGPLQQHNRRMMQGRGGFGDMFGMMNSIFSNMNPLVNNVDQLATGTNCQTYCSSTVLSYSKLGSGPPKVYQSTAETRSAPGGIREIRRSMRDSESGLEKVSIGHHIGERAHVLERSCNRHTGNREQRQEFINLDESEAAEFDDEWRRETSRYGGAGRSLGPRRDRASAPMALTYPKGAHTPPGHSHRYDW